MPPGKDWITVREAAAELRLDVKTVRNHIQAGDLRAIKAGRGRTSPDRIRRDVFDAYIASLAAEPIPA